MDKKIAAANLKKEGKSLRQIAAELGTSKSTVARWLAEPQDAVQKSWLNPRWTQVGGADHGPVDLYGAIEEPTKEALLGLYEDTCYTCTKWLSDQISSVPLKTYVKTLPHQKAPRCLTAPIRKSALLDHMGNIDLREVMEHPFKELIDTPNHEMNRNELLRVVDIDLSLTGNAYVFKRREEFEEHYQYLVNEGYPEALWPLPPQAIRRRYDDKGHFVGYEDNRTNPPKFYKKEDVIHFKLVDPRDIYGDGYGPVRGVFERVLIGKNEMAYLASLYRNQGRPDSIISIKDITAKEAERVQYELNQRFRQGGQHGAIVLDPEEADIKPLAWNPKDVLGTELYKWNKLQILNAFGLNPGIFDTESSNRAVADTARYMAMLNGVLPRLRVIEEKLNQHLAPEFDERLMVAFDNPVPEDHEAKLREQCELLDRNVITVNEVRKDRGLPPLEEEQDKPDTALLDNQQATQDDPTQSLRATVGGSQQVAALQQAVIAGTLTREMAIANARLVFGFSAEEAEILFPKDTPVRQSQPQLPQNVGEEDM